MPEGSAEANEYLQLSKPALDWQGQRNALPLAQIQRSMESEGQRLVSQYQDKTIIGKAGDTLSLVTDPIKNFFSLFSTNKDTGQASSLAYPITDTVTPITVSIAPAAVEEKTTFEKFALPVGIAVVSGIALLIIRR